MQRTPLRVCFEMPLNLLITNLGNLGIFTVLIQVHRPLLKKIDLLFGSFKLTSFKHCHQNAL